MKENMNAWSRQNWVTTVLLSTLTSQVSSPKAYIIGSIVSTVHDMRHNGGVLFLTIWLDDIRYFPNISMPIRMNYGLGLMDMI